MKLALFLIIAFTFQVAANAVAQKVDLDVKNESLEVVLKELGIQSGYSFIYNSQYLKQANPVSVSVRNKDVIETLPLVFANQPFEYTIKEKIITVIPKQHPPNELNVPIQQNTIRGKVTDSLNNPLQGVTVIATGTPNKAITDRDGLYELSGVPQDASLLFRLLSYETLEVPADRPIINVVLKYVYSYLDESIVIGYGTTTRRLNTGAVSKVSAEEIAKQPVANPLLALQGRVPGMYIQSTSGRPGSAINVQIRGQNSLVAGTVPLYIVDGVPFMGTPITPNTAISGQLTPFNSLNPADIESIEVLKDADATAIYGSRGANGVVLITTKKGQEGKAKLDFRLLSGFGEVAHFPEMLNTSEYLQMRRLAFELAGSAPTSVNAPDLIMWDTTQYTDWQRHLFGGKAITNDANISLSGGSGGTTFVIAGGFRKEGTVFHGDARNRRATTLLNLGHRTSDNKFHINLSFNYSIDWNDLNSVSGVSQANLPPHYPIYNDDDNYYWSPITSHANPETHQLRRSENKTQNFIGSTTLGYQLFEHFDINANLGYTSINTNQVNLYPLLALNPQFNAMGYSNFGQNQMTTWLIEPSLKYSKILTTQKIETLLGATWQESILEGNIINAWNIPDDALLKNIASAEMVNSTNTYSAYKFSSLFFRATYSVQERYVLNANFRRDGSTRFGPARRWGNFGAIGAAWIFTEESFFKNAKSWLSFGKLRGSYGITGNDQIGDYGYIPTYASVAGTYQIPGLQPTHIANSAYRWESNRKLEAAMELGLLRDRIMITTTYYQNTGKNQLIAYNLPSQTGFISLTDNFPAVIESRGWEFALNTTNIKNNNFTWNTSFNLTLPRTKLLGFPNLETSSYGVRNLIIGEPLGQIWAYDIEGIDPQTGLTMVKDLDNSGTVNAGDIKNWGTNASTLFGGLGNTFQWKNFQMDVFFRFNRQIGQSYTYLNGIFPGTANNITKKVWNNTWKQQGDLVKLPNVATNGIVSKQNYYINSYQGRYEDASFIKLSNIMLSYLIPQHVASKLKMETANIMFQGQNLFTVSPYDGYDPEALGTLSGNLPNLRILTFGIHCTF